jgi:uncharacterized protein (TIGR04222 family)
MELFSSWTGSDFLLFYGLLLGLASVAAWWIPAHLREPGRCGDSLDFESVAYLVGGRDRLVDALLADLFARGALSAADGQRLSIGEPAQFVDPAAKAVLALDPPLTRDKTRKALEAHAERIAARLRRAGLLLRSEELGRLRWLSVAPFAALFLLGLYRQRAGSIAGEPTGFLVVLLGLTVALAAIRFVRSDPRTQAGIAAVADLRARSSRAARAPRAEEAAMAVALFGTGVLVGTPWEAVHAMRQKDGDAGTGAESSSDGGSGDGGGGCGGCGG